eukprot:8954756-Alexandrium_andersonii.AAC.1
MELCAGEHGRLAHRGSGQEREANLSGPRTRKPRQVRAEKRCLSKRRSECPLSAVCESTKYTTG